MMRRVVTSAMVSRAVRGGRRTSAHQEKQTGADDMTWLEGDAEMTAETRYALLKQRELLMQQAAQINATAEERHDASQQRIASLEKKVKEMSAVLQSLRVISADGTEHPDLKHTPEIAG